MTLPKMPTNPKKMTMKLTDVRPPDHAVAEVVVPSPLAKRGLINTCELGQRPPYR
jgi:hypothetical protein